MSAAGKSWRELLPAGRGRFALLLSVQKQLALSRQLLAFRGGRLQILDPEHSRNPIFPSGEGWFSAACCDETGWVDEQ